MKEKGNKTRATTNNNYPPFPNTNTISWTLAILPTRYPHLFRATHLCLRVFIVQTKACCSKLTQQRWWSWGQWSNMVPNTALLQTTSHCLPLCLLYPAHPRAFPNLHSFPSNSPPPPQPFFHLKHNARQEWKHVGEPSTSFFVHFFSLFIGCNDLPLDPQKRCHKNN